MPEELLELLIGRYMGPRIAGREGFDRLSVDAVTYWGRMGFAHIGAAP